MPRFSEHERQVIKSRLLKEGERLFAAHGIKRVSVDELARAIGIAKGSFYSFYPSKEQLFTEIVFVAQSRLWEELEEFLQANAESPPRELLKRALIWMIGQFEHYPLLGKLDGETAEYLFRKLPEDVLTAHTRDDGEELQRLQKYGIHFTCDISIAAKTLQTISLGLFNLSSEDEDVRQTIMNLILDGIVKEIVCDTRPDA
jgi:AcrR family transcriptional regulator